MISKKLVRLACASAVMVTFSGGIIGLRPRNAHAATFSLASGDYNTAANWSPVGVPTATESRISLTGGSIATFNSPGSVTNTGRLLAGIGSGSSGTLTLSGSAGSLDYTSTSTLNSANYVGVDSGSGTLNVNAGTVNFTTADTTGDGHFHIAANSGTSATAPTGVVNVNGGTINVGTRVTIGAVAAPANGSGVVGTGGTSAGNGNGTLTINSGTVSIGTTTSVATGANVNKGYLSLKSATGGGGTATVNLNGGTLSLQRFSIGTGGTKVINFNGGTVQARGNDANFLNAVTGSTTNVGDGGAIFNTNSFDITIGSALVNNGAGGLQKLGGGILSLSGNNTYVGETEVSTGTLRLVTAGTNNIANSSAIVLANSVSVLDVAAVTGGFSLASLQTLSGLGTVTGNLTSSSNSTIAPNGTLSVNGHATLNGALQIDAVGALSGAYDQLLLGSIAGTYNLALSGTLTTNFTGGNWAADSDTLWILQNNSNGTLTGAFSNFPTNGQSIGIYAGKEWFINYGANSGTNSLTGGNDVALFAVAIPEPATYGVIVIGALVFGLSRTRSVKHDNVPVE